MVVISTGWVTGLALGQVLEPHRVIYCVPGPVTGHPDGQVEGLHSWPTKALARFVIRIVQLFLGHTNICLISPQGYVIVVESECMTWCPRTDPDNYDSYS